MRCTPNLCWTLPLEIQLTAWNICSGIPDKHFSMASSIQLFPSEDADAKLSSSHRHKYNQHPSRMISLDFVHEAEKYGSTLQKCKTDAGLGDLAVDCFPCHSLLGQPNA